MNSVEASPSDPGAALLEVYDEAVVDIHRYLSRRCPARVVDDLVAETFMAAVTSIRRGAVVEVTAAWLMTIARNKLVDHWRRDERERRRLTAIEGGVDDVDDPWDPVVDAADARHALATLEPTHRAVLTLRYLDGLPVAAVASAMDRSVGGIEALLTRAKRAFREAYEAAPAAHRNRSDDEEPGR